MELTSLTERPPIRIIAKSLSLGQAMPELKDLVDEDPHLARLNFKRRSCFFFALNHTKGIF